MTRNDIIQLAALPPAIHLPATIQLHPAVQVVDVPEYICTNLLRLNSPSPRLRVLAREALETVVEKLAHT